MLTRFKRAPSLVSLRLIKKIRLEFFQVFGGSAICSLGTCLGLFVWCHLLDIRRNNQARQRMLFSRLYYFSDTVVSYIHK